MKASFLEDYDSAYHPKKSYMRCYETHKPLPVGDGLVVYGGSCSHPIVLDADIYVGLDLSMVRSEKSYPWVDGESFLFHIPDMGVPGDYQQFKRMVEWLSVQLTAQKKVHVGCIGGHGRTGMVLSALVSLMTGTPDAISYVREHYCQKAVESQMQVDFLVKHFGILTATPAKGHSSTTTHGSKTLKKEAPQVRRPMDTDGLISAVPAKSAVSVWGCNVTLDKR